MARRNPLVPRLAYQHPGYFKIVVSLILTHAALAVDSVSIPANSLGFSVMRKVLDDNFLILSAFHVTVLVLLTVGLYWQGHFQLLRLGSAISAVVFNFMSVGFLFAAFIYGTAYFGFITCVALSLSSVAAAREPEDGPRSTP